jgi:hypothetical protein
MKRRTKWIISIAAVVVGVLGIDALIAVVGGIEDRNRQAGYEASLARYTHDLTVGSSRDDVAKYIRSRGEEQRPDYPRGRHGILVNIGEQPATWVCDRSNMFLLLRFSDSDRYEGASLKQGPLICW